MQNLSAQQFILIQK